MYQLNLIARKKDNKNQFILAKAFIIYLRLI